MKRAAEYLNIWKSCRGRVQPGGHIAVVGGGISGLNLAAALRQREFSVTVFEQSRTGGVRIPFMHACHTLKARAPLWEKAAAFSRPYYRAAAQHGGGIAEHSNACGAYFIVLTRKYLRALKTRLLDDGVGFVAEAVQPNIGALPGFDLTCVATGAATQHIAATQRVAGWQSYFAAQAGTAQTAHITRHGGKITNYMYLSGRAGFIHQKGELRDTAEKIGKEIHPTGRHALFQGERLTTRDRFPVVGFLNANAAAPFMFCAMGYHAMTYAPYLAHAVAAQLAGAESVDENLVCTLTPARFHSRK